MLSPRTSSSPVRSAFAATVLSTLAVPTLTSPAAAQETLCASVAISGPHVTGSGDARGVSDDGRFVLFNSFSPDLVAGDTNMVLDVFVRDVALGTTELASLDASGGTSLQGGTGIAMTPDARYVLFWCTWPLTPNDTNGSAVDGYVRDRVLGTTELVTLDATGSAVPAGGRPTAITPDGRFITFVSESSTIVGGDTNGVPDAFVRDRVLGTTERVSLTNGGAEANLHSEPRALTPDGRFVVFRSWASNLVPGDTNGRYDFYVRDRQLGVTERISIATSGAEPLLFDVEPDCSISADGRFVAFASGATTLVPGDTNARLDVFLRDRQFATTTRVSESALGAQANNHCTWPVLTADGSRLFFSSGASNLVSGDVNGAYDVFVRDLGLGTVELVSLATSGAQGDGGSSAIGPYCSLDGRFFAFTSAASNLTAGDTNVSSDAFVRDLSPSIASFCSGDGSFVDHTSACPCGNTGSPGRGCGHSFDANGALLDATGSPAFDDVVLHSHATPATSFTLFLQHDALGDAVFHDGVLCAGGTLVRLRGRAAVAGEASFPNNAFANDSTLTLSQRGGGLWHSGLTRFYSAWYRNASTTFCPPATANVTNGLIIDW